MIETDDFKNKFIMNIYKVTVILGFKISLSWNLKYQMCHRLVKKVGAEYKGCACHISRGNARERAGA
jgi:hypothetical protein